MSLRARSGDLISIIGPSGCGKSTFLRCLNLLEIPDSGTLQVNGVQIAKSSTQKWGRAQEKRAHALRAHVGMVFQSFNLFSHKTVLQNMMMAPRAVKKLPVHDVERVAGELLAKVGLSGMEGRYPSTLSGGQQQRAAIARALAMRPDVMLYDEPTSALDPELAQEVLHVMRTLDEEGMTQIVVTHDMRFARAASDCVLYLEKGNVVEAGDPEDIFTAPQDPRTRRFLRTFL